MLAARAYVGLGLGEISFNQQIVVGRKDIRGYTQGEFRGDQVVAILKENNYSVKSESYANMAHSSCGREEQDMLDFFKTTLA